MVTLLVAGLATTVGLMILAWLLSLALASVAIVDVFWGLAIAGAGCIWCLMQPQITPRAGLVTVLAVLWAGRLALHLLWRSRGQPEDRRYRAIRARNQPHFAFKSLYLVFALQAVLAWLVAMPLLGTALGTAPWRGLDVVGALLWLAGFGLQVTADAQLARFQRRPGADRGVLRQGVWRYSRHPNYFGEFLLWWGLWLMAVAAGAWWTVFAPLLLTFFLLRVSGVALTEKDIATRRPDYQDYIRRTSAFVLWPPD